MMDKQFCLYLQPIWRRNKLLKMSATSFFDSKSSFDKFLSNNGSTKSNQD